MTDDDLKLLYRWSKEELQSGNRIKASRIKRVFDKFREIRGDASWNNGYISHIDNFNVELLMVDLALRMEQKNERNN